MTYTITNVIPSGESHETYGDKYHIKFAESPETFELWFKKKPEEGSTVDGTIDGRKFKKEKQSYNSSRGAKKTYGAVEKDKQDGMRQGMCFNNATHYVTEISTKPLTPVEWADAVFKYATALYSKGDLKAVTAPVRAPESEPSVDPELSKEEILDLFEQ